MKQKNVSFTNQTLTRVFIWVVFVVALSSSAIAQQGVLVLPSNGIIEGLVPLNRKSFAPNAGLYQTKPLGFYVVRMFNEAREVHGTVEYDYGGRAKLFYKIVLDMNGNRRVVYDQPRIVYINIKIFRYWDGQRFSGPEIRETDLPRNAARYY